MSPRILDWIYIVYFGLMAPISILLDIQPFYPQHLVPQALKNVRNYMIFESGDPLFGSTLGGPVQMAWFESFIIMEAFFQIPTYFLAIYGLLKGKRLTYILTLVYGVQCATTTVPCIATFLAMPIKTVDTPVGIPSLTPEDLSALMRNYVPFIVLPLIMALDSAWQLAKDVRAGQAALKGRKSK